MNIRRFFQVVLAASSREDVCPFPPLPDEAAPYPLKRPLDILVGSVMLIITLPLWAVIAALIKIDDGGPVFFIQPRVGRSAKVFNMMKFRTMIPGAAEIQKEMIHLSDIQGGFKMKNDPRVTRVGRVLRRMKIDELPQILNVLSGTMSLVGPRPTSIEEVKRSYDASTCRKFLSGVKPGITGWTQVRESCRGKMDLLDQLNFDLEYVRNQGLLVDCLILLMTPPAIMFGKGN
jgi:lipopolysaccharide/colanic/teichoic acid biosynthesis glycosyltransferase